MTDKTEDMREEDSEPIATGAIVCTVMILLRGDGNLGLGIGSLNSSPHYSKWGRIGGHNTPYSLARG